MSRCIKDLINISNKPPHKNKTTSRDGSLSDKPIINDKTEGIVAQWTNTIASHPTASADKCENFSAMNFLHAIRIKSNFSIYLSL